MPIEGKEAAPGLVGPHLDLVIVTTCISPISYKHYSNWPASSPEEASCACPQSAILRTRDKQGLVGMESDTANGAIVLFESVNQGAHSVVPELDRRGVEGYENPWSKAAWLAEETGCETGGEALGADRFGWNAMPFARDDLDSNCGQG